MGLVSQLLRFGSLQVTAQQYRANARTKYGEELREASLLLSYLEKSHLGSPADTPLLLIL